jgi:exopolysaccharide biosynthesis polyprenyl glycosylphosphotransferase
MLGRYSRVIGALLFIIDAAAIVGCFIGAFFLKRHYVLADDELQLETYLGLLTIEVPFILVCLAASGLYSSRSLVQSLGAQFRTIAKVSAIIFVVFVIVSFYAKLFSYSRAIFSLFFAFMIPGLMVSRIALSLVRRLTRRDPAFGRRILVISDSSLTDDLCDRLSKNAYCTFEFIRMEGSPQVQAEMALKRIEQGKVSSLLIDLPFEELAAITDVATRAEREGVDVFLSPRAFPVAMLRPTLKEIGGTPLIALRSPEISLAGRIAKRSMDLVLSVLGLIVLSPLFLLIAIAVRLASKGPALYKQRRVGLDGHEFTMLKFRTMRADAEKDVGPIWAESNDDERCTPIGSMLRKLNLDELPQLFNVLVGSMSLVGPRPERPEFVKQFKEDIDRYAHKHWMKPGITGWAQVNGWRGPTDLAERIRHDMWYIEQWSLWLDVKIILLTLFGRKHRAA